MSKNNGKGEKYVSEFPQPARKKTFSEMFYDPSEGSFFGRTPKSWGQLLAFYVIFYIILAILFAICMKGMLSTLDSEKPKWTMENSLIGTNPGMGFRPLSEQTERGSVIEYKKNKTAEVDYWTGLLNDFLKDYNHTEGRNMKYCDLTPNRNASNACVVNMDQFGPCSPSKGYGYAAGKPCIFLKLNKIYDWEPTIYDKPIDTMPEDLQKLINNKGDSEPGKIWVTCNGHFGKDKENFQNISFYPSQGFPAYYYPYKKQNGYLSPLVAVQINDPPEGKMLDVECRAWAKNIIYSGSLRDRMGSVTFQVLVD